jgi:hypothetical protein
VTAPKKKPKKRRKKAVFQADLYGIAMQHGSQPAKLERKPSSWHEVWQRIDRHLRALADGSFALLVDIVDGARKVVRGVTSLPPVALAVLARIAAGHKKVDEEQAKKEEAVKTQAVPSPTRPDALSRIEVLLQQFQAEGKAVQLIEVEGGWAIVVVRPDRVEAAIAVANAIELGGNAPLPLPADPTGLTVTVKGDPPPGPSAGPLADPAQ